MQKESRFQAIETEGACTFLTKVIQTETMKAKIRRSRRYPAKGRNDRFQLMDEWIDGPSPSMESEEEEEDEGTRREEGSPVQ